MRFVFLSYHYSADIDSTEAWIKRLKFYVGSLEVLSREHTVIRVDQVNYEGHFFHNGVEYHCINNGKKKNFFPTKLHRFVKALQPDIIVVSSFLFPLQVLQLREQLGKKVKIIIQHHAERPFTGIKKYLQRKASHVVDAFIFASRSMGEDWVSKKNIHDAKKIHEIVGGSSHFYPIAKQTAREVTGITADPCFLWVGRLNANKDPLLVINAFLRFAEKQPAARLYMIYQENDLLDPVKRRIKASRTNDAIVLVGKVFNEELLYWFNSVDFYISASHYEGSGTALGEAMSCACIPIVTDIFSFKAITNNGNCGILYEAGDAAALLHALQKAIQLDKGKEKKKVADHFISELSFTAIAGKFQSIACSL